MKFKVADPVVLEKERPVELTLHEEADGAVYVRATRGTVKADVIRLSTNGKIYRIIGQPLTDLGFEADGHGKVVIG